MIDENPWAGTVLITGGTSGLGLELVRLFLAKGFSVVATGRKALTLQGYERSFHLFCIDFSDLQKTADITNQICGIYNFDIVIDNAGILSPENFTSTMDGLEYTYQVNYLAHLLMNEIIIKKHDISKPLKIAAVTSPVYRIAQHDLSYAGDKNSYGAIKSLFRLQAFSGADVPAPLLEISSQEYFFLQLYPGSFRIRDLQDAVFAVSIVIQNCSTIYEKTGKSCGSPS